MFNGYRAFFNKIYVITLRKQGLDVKAIKGLSGISEQYEIS